MTSELDSRTPTPGERRRTRAYLREFLIGIVAYAVLLTVALRFGGFDGDSPWRFAWAALPVLPMVWIAIAVLRHIRRVDEYQREKLLMGCAAGFAVAMLASVLLGILQSAGLQLAGSGFWVYGAGMTAWAINAAVTGRR